MRIRDLFTGERPTEVTLQDLVRDNPPLEPNHDENDALAGTWLPGDDPAERGSRYTPNPYGRMNPMNILRALREGRVPPDQIALARAALARNSEA